MTPRETAAQREARMARAAAGRSAPEAARPATRAVRTRPVRITVDLDPAQHRALGRWAADAAAELDVAKVPSADVVRALLHLLTTDRRVAADVMEELLEQRR